MTERWWQRREIVAAVIQTIAFLAACALIGVGVVGGMFIGGVMCTVGCDTSPFAIYAAFAGPALVGASASAAIAYRLDPCSRNAILGTVGLESAIAAMGALVVIQM